MITETLTQYLQRKHTDATAKTYQFYIEAFLTRCPKAKKFMYSDIINYLNDVKQQNNGSKTILTTLASVKKYYDYLLETGQRNDHPIKYFKIKQGHRVIQLQDLFTSTELEMLMNRENRYPALANRNKVIISLLIYQGLQASEIVRLELKDVDLDTGTVNIKGSKKVSGRTLDLRPSQIMLIQKYIYHDREKLLGGGIYTSLIITHRGTPETVEGINSMLQPLKGLYPDRSLNAVTIRQSVISNLLNERKQRLEDVQLFAGHKWPSSTEMYKRYDVDEQRTLINMYHPMK